ncbi:PREDICTED: LRRN4 C-terminal-like protein [Gekko japonicus]|uniref:LRRN4 C-terminal-like protein n=1 Tax=Gekko japonicus TaxID=146911 RepID=A0ABM1K1T4_GEKJA|nr:PREDICTED: LRRN4 C-terminal-like protein [Gekko japonicus]
MPGTMRIQRLFMVAIWILVLCPRGSPTSFGHPLPVPLKDNYSPPSGSNTPVVIKDKPSLPASSKSSQEDTDYYDDDYPFTVDPLETPRSPQAPPPHCDYHRCHHLQVPCAELQKASGCLCPGITRPDVAPEAPHLQTIHVSEGGASLHWCAPSSPVEQYHVTYQVVGEAPASGPALNSTFRLATISGLLPNKQYLVCVVASNQAGRSRTDDGEQEHGPCRLVQTPPRQMPYVYVAAGLAATLVLIVISALVWHFCMRRRKHLLHGSRDNILDGEPGPSGTTNTTFRSEEQL